MRAARRCGVGSKSPRPSGSTLRWVSARRVRRAYNLQSGDEVIGSIRWRGLFGSLAEAEYRGRTWTFKRGGFLRPRVTIREAGTEENLGVLELAMMGGGVLSLRDGSRFRWERAGFWTQRFNFTDERGTEIVAFKPKHSIVRRAGAIEASPSARRHPAFGLLVTLGWYMFNLIADDDASSAAAAASAG